MQRFHHGSSWFPVHPKETAPAVTDDLALTYFTNILKQSSSVVAQPDIRNITPWLRITGWHTLIVGKKAKDIVALVKVPDKPEFPALVKAVDRIFFDASELIALTPLLVLQKIVSPLPSQV